MGAGAAGYIGKMAEVFWIERAYNLIVNPGKNEWGLSVKSLGVESAAQLNHFMDES
jgi:hypothetical protein